MSSEVDTAADWERGRLLEISSKEAEQFGRGRLLQLSERRAAVRAAAAPRGILVLRQQRSYAVTTESEEEFDSESSVLVSKRPAVREKARRSRSAPRRPGSDSSVVTFLQEQPGDSLRSASSYDVSKISFQGKRALFESGVGPRVVANGRQPSRGGKVGYEQHLCNFLTLKVRKV